MRIPEIIRNLKKIYITIFYTFFVCLCQYRVGILDEKTSQKREIMAEKLNLIVKSFETDVLPPLDHTIVKKNN